MKWIAGLTTVPQRRDTYLPKTLESLAAAGFPDIRLFVDGVKIYEDQLRTFECQGRPVTIRCPRVGIVMNWWLGLIELYGRNPDANRYAIFQDDFVMVKNLKPYLESSLSGNKAYWNLYTFHDNEPELNGKPIGWHEGSLIGGANTKQLQRGRGAVALVFSNEGVRTLLSSNGFVEKVRNPDPAKSTKNLDGCIVNTMNSLGWREQVHWPSLVRHTGLISNIDRPGHGFDFPFQPDHTFPGETFNAMEWIK